MAHILIVDDEVYIRRIIEYNLKKDNYDITLCEDVEAARALIEKGVKFDLIITDLMMPVFSGLDFIREIRKKYKMEEQKIIILSAKGMEKDIEEAKKYNVDGYLMKPFGFKELKECIKNALNGIKNY